ncbi:hypothetical protein ACIHCQ_18035 [Streptomyces sp. NPDC052236]|uniref:hypothetical protein n=1 Tax=Streptomyces sp. NPDC052236 TaxID=3365686 RepID=UPI0037D61F6A
MERNLRALPGLHRECLHQMSSTSRRMNNPTKVSGSRKRDHLDISTLDTRHKILAILESWSGIIVEELKTIAPAHSVPHVARFLIINLEWLTAQPPAADFADEIENLHAELLRTIDPEPGNLHTLIRECVVDNCTGKISASPQNTGNAGKSSISCDSGHSWEMREWLILRQLMNRQRKDAA